MQIMIHKKLVIIAFGYTTVYKSFEKFMYLFYKKLIKLIITYSLKVQKCNHYKRHGDAALSAANITRNIGANPSS